MGCVNDAFKVYCNFTSGETCLYPKKTMYEKKKWVESGKDGFRWMMEELAQEKVGFVLGSLYFMCKPVSNQLPCVCFRNMVMQEFHSSTE